MKDNMCYGVATTIPNKITPHCRCYGDNKVCKFGEKGILDISCIYYQNVTLPTDRYSCGNTCGSSKAFLDLIKNTFGTIFKTALTIQEIIDHENNRDNKESSKEESTRDTVPI